MLVSNCCGAEYVFKYICKACGETSEPIEQDKPSINVIDMPMPEMSDSIFKSIAIELFEDIEEVAPFLENTWSTGKSHPIASDNKTMTTNELWSDVQSRIKKLLRPDDPDQDLISRIMMQAKARRNNEMLDLDKERERLDE